jgi:hypothetical protein
MQFSHQKRGQKFHDGFKAGIEEVVILLKQHKDDSIERIIIALEHAITLLNEKKK